MRVTLPNRAYLGDIERFLACVTDDASTDLTFALPEGLFSVHPIVLCLIGALGEVARTHGGIVKIENERNNSSTRYLERVGLFEVLGVRTSIEVKQPREAAGRFVPLQTIRTNDELNEFVLNLGPLLHATPEQTKTTKYVIFEMVRNVLEHSRSTGGAYVAAQVARKSGRLLLGVADAGVGVKESLSVSHQVFDHRQAITLAFRPGVTGTTRKFGGNETNGGAGLFFMKAMVQAGGHHMVMVTGDQQMKFLKQKKARLNPLLDHDRVTWKAYPMVFPGTAVGVDLSAEEASSFEMLMSRIRDAYGFSVRAAKRERAKTARFL
jgi:anti-sigma regulatory factor (Ser/Thr protein kinase)